MVESTPSSVRAALGKTRLALAGQPRYSRRAAGTNPRPLRDTPRDTGAAGHLSPTTPEEKFASSQHYLRVRARRFAWRRRAHCIVQKPEA
jgi:hypothetical protein